MTEDSAEMSAKSVGMAADSPNSVEPRNHPESSALHACCVETIRNHVLHNPMMVCSKCKFIIKCFTDERAYQNYLVFCRSRRRPIVTDVIDGYFTCAFRSYDTFSR
jgi:hypothetical protein